MAGGLHIDDPANGGSPPGSWRAALSPSASCKACGDAERILRERSRRALLFPHLDEPAWLMLVDLYVHRGRDISVTSACCASFAPLTTGLRHIGLLVEAGLIVRERDQGDGRKTYLRLTATAIDALASFFEHRPVNGGHRDNPGASAAAAPFHSTVNSAQGQRDHA